MSLFEFVTVMISMILALTLGQLLSGATFLLRTSGEVRWYAPHTLWVCGMGLGLVNHWWALWDFRDLDWNYATFLYILIAPLMAFLAVGLLTPDRESNDMQRQFARVRRPFGALVCAYVLAM
jgi:H+/Cl- antiporter ClcA